MYSLVNADLLHLRYEHLQKAHDGLQRQLAAPARHPLAGRPPLLAAPPRAARAVLTRHGLLLCTQQTLLSFFKMFFVSRVVSGSEKKTPCHVCSVNAVVNLFGKVRLGEISEMFLLPLRG
jgi:hypothetical protein